MAHDSAGRAQGSKTGEHNVIIGSPAERDIEVCFGPLEDDDAFVSLPDNVRWPQLLKAVGAFPSTSQARKNGWDKDVEPGWSDVWVGRRRICVLKTRSAT